VLDYKFIQERKRLNELRFFLCSLIYLRRNLDRLSNLENVCVLDYKQSESKSASMKESSHFVSITFISLQGTKWYILSGI
jgi:hypothetical protein